MHEEESKQYKDGYKEEAKKIFIKRNKIVNEKKKLEKDLAELIKKEQEEEINEFFKEYSENTNSDEIFEELQKLEEELEIEIKDNINK